MRKDPVSQDPKQPDDLLSAYFDGEATPEESAAAERRMYESDEARREHREIGEISRLLQSLPRDTPPQELAPSVLQRAERETLLAADKQLTSTSAVRRTRLVIGGSLFATAAAVLAMVWLVDSPPEPDDRVADMGIASTGSAAPETTLEREVAARNDVARASVPVEAETAGGSRRLFSEGAADMPTAASESPPTSVIPSKPGPGREPADAVEVADAGLPEDFDLNKARIGDVIPYLERSGDRVTVIKIAVVDVERAVGVLRVTLAKYSVPRYSDWPAEAVAEEDSGLVEFKNQADGLLAIYAEAPGEHLANAMDHFRQQYQDEKKTVSLAMEPALELNHVEVAAIDPVAINARAGARFGNDGVNTSKQTLADAVRMRAAQNQQRGVLQKDRTEKTTGNVVVSPKQKGASKKTDDQPQAESVSADEAVTKKTPRLAQPGVTDAEKPVPKESESDLVVDSFQMLVNLDSKTLALRPQQRRAQRTGDKQIGSSPGEKAKSFSSPARPVPAVKTAVPHAPVRVIFVFHKTTRGPAGS
jgi:hypothetical protein